MPAEKVNCAACKHIQLKDLEWPTLCRYCATKLRAIDGEAASPYGIRKDMIDSGIPLRRKGEGD